MKSKLLTLLLLVGGSIYGGVSIGINIGAPPPPRMVQRSASPGPGYEFVNGYWYPNGRHYKWHDGYWTRPPYEGALWVEPRHDGHQYFAGYWQAAGRDRVEHNHRSDRNHDRDYNKRDR